MLRPLKETTPPSTAALTAAEQQVRALKAELDEHLPKWEREAAEKFVGPLPGSADADDEQMRCFYAAFLKDDLRGPTDRRHLRLGLT